MMHGRIWVDAAQSGKGSTICFTVVVKIAGQAAQLQQDLHEQVGRMAWIWKAEVWQCRQTKPFSRASTIIVA